MSTRTKHKSRVALAVLAGVAGVAALAAIAVGGHSGGQAGIASAGAPVTAAAGSLGAAAGGALATSEDKLPHIVVFRDEPLATYKGGIAGLPAAPRFGGGRGRIDVKSPQAKAYVDVLAGRQRGYEARMARVLGRELRVAKRMQHAIDGIVTHLSAAEAQKMLALPEVVLVEPYREYALETDAGPAIIGAPAAWSGGSVNLSSTPLPKAKGEGIVVGIIDTGINFGSPSFAAIGGDGYRVINPRGAGNYLGTCAPGGVDAGRCNDKLIGGWDFVCAAPGNMCGAADTREEPGFGDTNSHGSHTAATSAGNHRAVNFRTNAMNMAGVAPHANIIAYDVCFTRVSTGQGSCPNTSSLAAVNQAIADGVHVINFSIGGGSAPWSEAVSLAFLNAADAGIFVATSAGNSGPGPGTLGHVEPWVAASAASQHGRGDVTFALNVTGPGTVPGLLQGLPMNAGTGGTDLAAALPGTTPLKVSPTLDSGTDGCTAFAPNQFQNAIAVVRRGGCNFTDKVANAAAAGARAVVIANNAAGVIIPTVTGAAIPAFSVLQADGNAIRDFAAGKTGLTAGMLGVILDNKPDALAAFSSRGPNNYDLLKPDVTAPGVDILAVIAGTTLTGSENAVGLMSGTSMASPHTAGAAALLRQIRPSWTAAEIKSALMMTAQQTVLLEDGTTAANPLAAGAGRIRVDLAARTGLVLNETKARYLAANPALGGDPSALNQPSMAKSRCIGKCTFVRTFRSPVAYTQVWQPKLVGLAGTVYPTQITARPGMSYSVTVTVDTRTQPSDGAWRFGALTMTPLFNAGGKEPVLRLPIAVAVPSPTLALSTEQITLSLPAGQNSSRSFTVLNSGGPTLGYSFDTTGVAIRPMHNAPANGVTSGFRASTYSDQGGAAQYASDDFTLTSPTRVTRLYAEGFTLGATVAAGSSSLTWSIYPDSNGQPAGNPKTNPAAAVWTYSAPVTGAGVSTVNNHITLDLGVAGQNVVLPPGRYWLVVNNASTFANRWIWYASNSGSASGGFMNITTPTQTAWLGTTGFAGLAFRVDGAVACGAPWLSPPSPFSGNLAANGSALTQVGINAASLAPGSYEGYVCINSNDAARPKASIKVSLTVTP